jgi:hypothetical protein
MSENRETAAKVKSIHVKLSHLLELGSGWDGEEGEAPNETALTWASLVIEAAERNGASPTSIVPCPDDGVSILFSRGEKQAAIECFNTGDLSAGFSGHGIETTAWDIENDEHEVEKAVQRISDFLG